jgi:hypothetical protein
MPEHGRRQWSLGRRVAWAVAILLMSYACVLHASPPSRDDVVSAGQFKARAYLDPLSRTIFYVETDGRHLSAIAPDGKLLWTRNPYVDAGSHYYRRKEIITYVGPLSAQFTEFMKKQKVAGPFIGIGFDSTQFGALDVKTGNFFNLGQD